MKLIYFYLSEAFKSIEIELVVVVVAWNLHFLSFFQTQGCRRWKNIFPIPWTWSSTNIPFEGELEVNTPAEYVL